MVVEEVSEVHFGQACQATALGHRHHGRLVGDDDLAVAPGGEGQPDEGHIAQAIDEAGGWVLPAEGTAQASVNWRPSLMLGPKWRQESPKIPHTWR